MLKYISKLIFYDCGYLNLFCECKPDSIVVFMCCLVDVDSALCSCMQSAGAKWPTKCFTVRVLHNFAFCRGVCIHTLGFMVHPKSLRGTTKIAVLALWASGLISSKFA